MLFLECLRIGAAQLGSPEVTHPLQGASLSRSWIIQLPAFSFDSEVTIFLGSLLLKGWVPLSVIWTVEDGLRTEE